MNRPIRVLVADDSATVRAALRLHLASHGLVVAGEARDGVEAVRLAKTLLPDVITMDVRMPELDGLEATAAIMASAPTRILMVCALSEREQQDISFRAIAAGALEVIAKPSVGAGEDAAAWGAQVARAVRVMAEVPVITRRRLTPAEPQARYVTPPPPLPSPDRPRDFSAFAIVASTGGPPLLEKILAAMPPTLPFPILVAQHIASGFSEGLVRWLRGICAIELVLVTGSEPLRPGAVYFATDAHDLEIGADGRVWARPSPAGVCPSGDRLLHSLARSHGATAGAVILTGMGEDGAAGLLELRRAGGLTLAQDAASCVVGGMPAAAERLGGVMRRVRVTEVVELLLSRAGPRAA